MTDKRVLTIQDISCFGQCSLTVALPIISACGIETAVIPSAVLSTHTSGFTGYTCRDLAEDIPKIHAHWKETGILFDAVYTGYLGSSEMIEDVMEIMRELGTENSINIVDPAMADEGVLYPAFDMAYVEEMKKLCAAADIILPNITEACMLTGMEFKTEYDEAYIQELLAKLNSSTARSMPAPHRWAAARHTEPVYYPNQPKANEYPLPSGPKGQYHKCCRRQDLL